MRDSSPAMAARLDRKDAVHSKPSLELQSRTASVLLDPVRDQIEDLGRELHLGAWFSRLRWLRAHPHPVVDVWNRGHREVGVRSFTDVSHKWPEVRRGVKLAVASAMDCQE